MSFRFLAKISLFRRRRFIGMASSSAPVPNGVASSEVRRPPSDLVQLESLNGSPLASGLAAGAQGGATTGTAFCTEAWPAQPDPPRDAHGPMVSGADDVFLGLQLLSRRATHPTPRAQLLSRAASSIQHPNSAGSQPQSCVPQLQSRVRSS